MWATRTSFQSKQHRITAVLLCILMTYLVLVPAASAINQVPNPPPAPGSYGLEATKTQAPPKTAATITTPQGGAFSTSPITVSGLCTKGLLVQIYDNGVMVGAIDCPNGSFQLQITLFTGINDISALQFDDLYQPGPESNHVSVTFNNASFTAFGQLITLTSTYGRRGANPGTTLTWPLQLTGGQGPYAMSIDWGDGKPAQLKSISLAGNIDITHVYDKSGIYHVTIKVTDTNGVTAFLQVVAIANGKASASGSGTTNTTTVITKILWIPAAICFCLLFLAYWLGRRSELISLHKQLEKDMRRYNEG